MNKISLELEKWMNEMISLFPWITFKYEEKGEKEFHRICVYPQELIDSCEEYCKEEVLFSMRLEDTFPHETVLFSTEEAIFACSDSAKIYCTEPINGKTIEPIVELKYNYQCTTPVNTGEEDYSLAA